MATVHVANIPFSELHLGLVRALLKACRDGMPAVVFAGQVALRIAEGHVIVSANQAERHLLEDRLAQVRRRQARAKEAYLGEDDTDVAASFKATFDDATAEIRRLQIRLQDLRTSDDDPLPQGAVEADVDVLLRAVRTLLDCSAKATRAQIYAFHTVVPDLRVVQTSDGSWQARAVVRLPVADGVADFGPIEWPLRVKTSGVQVAHATYRPAAPKLPAESREEVRGRLEEQGVTHEMARTLLNSPFRRELTELVLHRASLEDLPGWLPLQWREPGFAAQVARTFLDDSRAWAAMGRYLVRSAPRQALLSLLGEYGGAMSMADLKLLSPRLHAFAQNCEFNARSVEVARQWPMPFAWEGAPGNRTLRAHRCTCGAVATAVVRVPEVPSALLCSCGRAAMAERYGLDAVRFPEDYQALAVREQEWRAAMIAAPQIAERAKRETYSPRIAEFLAEGKVATTSQIMEHLGLSRDQTSRLLSDDPQIERAGRLGRADMTWRVTQAPAATS